MLESLFAPSDIDEFLQSSFERAPLHIARNDPGHFARLYGIADVEDALFVGAAQPERFTLVKDGVALAFDQYASATPPPRRPWSRERARPPSLDPRIVLAQFDRGYTLVISDATQLSPRLARLCNRLQGRLGTFVVANVYFTPAGARGFDVHYDSHGILVLQIAGRKTWRVYEPLSELPTETQPFSKERHAHRLSAAREIVLAPGDTLYLPQGTPHEATAGEQSLHVTLALAPPRASDLLARLVDVLTASDVELRRALPVGWQASPEIQRAFAELVGRRLGAVPPQSVALAAELLLGDLSAATRPAPQGMFAALSDSVELDASSTVRLRDDAPYAVSTDGITVRLVVADRVFTLPAACAPLLERLRDGAIPYAEAAAALGAGEARDFVKLLALVGLLGS